MIKALLIVLFSFSLMAEDLKETQRYAEALFKRRFYKDAIAEFSKSSKSLNPKIRNHSYLRLSNCYEQLKEHQKALDFFLLYRPDSASNRTQIELKKAILHQNAKLDQEAVEILEKLSKNRSSKFWLSSQYYLAQSLIRLNETSKAKTILEKISNAPFDDPHKIKLYSRLTLGELHYKSKELKESKKQLSKLLQEKDLSSAIKKQGSILLANTLSQLKEHQAAVNLFNSLLKDFPELANSDKLSYHYAKSLIETKNVSEARKILNNNNDRSAYLNAYSFLKEQQWDKAAHFFTEFLIQHKDSNLKENASFFTCYSLSQSKKDLELLTKTVAFIKDFPKSSLLADIHLYRALAQQRAKKKNEAIKDFKKAIALGQKQQAWPNLGKAIIQLAKSLQSQKLFDEAILQWQKLIADKAHNSLALQNTLLLLKKSPNAALRLSQILSLLELNKTQLSEAELESIALAIQQNLKDKSHTILTSLLTYQNKKNKIQGLIAHNQFKLLNYKQCLIEFNKISKANLSQFDQIIIGYCYKKNKEDNKALAHWDIAFEKESSPKIPLDSLLYIARELVLNENYQSSQNIYSSLLNSENDKHQSEALNALAFIELKNENYAKALNLAQKALKLEANQLILGELYCTFAEIYLKQNKKDLAVLELDKISSLQKASNFSKARSNYLLALFYFKNKDYEQAHTFASRSYILFKNKSYSAKAMLLDIKALQKLGRSEDNKIIIQELKESYPELYKEL